MTLKEFMNLASVIHPDHWDNIIIYANDMPAFSYEIGVCNDNGVNKTFINIYSSDDDEEFMDSKR